MPDMLQLLKIDAEFDHYSSQVGLNAFSGLADELPAISVDELSSKTASKPSVLEKAYTKQFMEVLGKLHKKAHNEAFGKYSESPFSPTDYQNRPVSGSTLKPDIVFFGKTAAKHSFGTAHLIVEAKAQMTTNEAYSNHLGQLADYALAVRKEQPMRRFVPLLFLIGSHLDLLVFTHAGYYKTAIGPILYDSDMRKANVRFRADVASSLHTLWFLLTLPSCKFGHLVQSPGVPKSLLVVPGELASIDFDGDNSEGECLVLKYCIPRSTRITGRCTYLLNASFRDRDVVLKMSWTRVNRLPEGAVYEVLNARKPTDTGGEASVQGIPTVFASGIIVDDFDGYRLEFLVIEHCGDSILDHFASLRNTSRYIEAAEQAENYIKQVTSTLAQALKANVLHRDISTGNITVKNKRAYLIDWGYAKCTQPPDEPLKTSIANRWGINWDQVLATEQAHDPFTGTPMYMSIQMLRGVTRRGIYNDLESLFYVVLDLFSDRNRDSTTEDPPLGFRFYSSESMAVTRVGCMAAGNLYFEFFGIVSLAQYVPVEVLESMRRFLFFQGESFIGGKLLAKDGFEREVSHELASQFMDAATVRNLLTVVPNSQVEQSPVKAEMVDISASLEVTL
ncbi:hypothetical protein GGI04_003786, partial [Coemansia thaxteri]